MALRTLAVLALLAVLTSCSGDPEPKVSPAPSPTLASPVESSAEPEVETPEAFIKRWAELETTMQNSGDSTVYRSVTVGCVPCAKTADLVDAYYAAGGFVRFEGRRVQSQKPFESDPGTAVFRVSMISGPTSFKKSADSREKSFGGGSANYKVYLNQVATGWNVSDYTQLSS